MLEGTVKFFRTDKGYGFIAPADRGADVFVHVSDLERSSLSSLRAGQKVTFNVEKDLRSGKPRATNVRLA